MNYKNKNMIDLRKLILNEIKNNQTTMVQKNK